MSHPKVEGVHLVGSIPLPTEEDSFRTACSHLSSHLKRIPDGEPGIRGNFVRWQLALWKDHPLVLHEFFNPDAPVSFSDEEADRIVESLPNFETRFEDYALASYEMFKILREEGVIPHGVRFQVGLPTPVSVVALTVRKALQSRVERVYEAAILRSLQYIQTAIPSSDLSIQWDLPIEFAMLENAEMLGTRIESWFGDALEGITDRLARLGESVVPDVELGYHFCYGDSSHKHFIEPKDINMMVKVAEGLLAKCIRKISWIHMPEPKVWTDEAYYKPLERLVPLLGDAELILGLVHFDDREGTKARIASAGAVIREFSVGSECGFGRTPPEQLDNILDLSASVSEAVR